MKHGVYLVFVAILLLMGCAQEGVPNTAVSQTTGISTNTSTATNTATATATATPTSTPTATFTPIPTPTPTATAVPVTLVGEPRDGRLSEPVTQSNAPCGLVDLLDFPIDPPDATGISFGGQDFGVYRSRYEKHHAGEDWGGPNGRSNNFGTPVYSIGHGLVTYAHPEGWNRDKGVIIIQHTFTDGSSILSFYGHLDPPSVIIEPGDCVTRGEQIGAIGRPRTPPHLHFEIRTHMPYTPGPGYWSEDPTTAGWLPPSQTIWEQRISSSPNVDWTKVFTTPIQPIGQIYTDSVTLLNDGKIVEVALTNGRITPNPTITETVDHALIHNNHLYTASRFGQLNAYSLPDFTPLWQTDLGRNGSPLLLPIPSGGVAVSVQTQLWGINENGTLLWEKEVEERPFAWDHNEEHLILATRNQVYSITLEQPLLLAKLSGYPIISGETIWLYADNALYQLAHSEAVPRLIKPLPKGRLVNSSAISLPDGSILLIHTDLFDKRLIRLQADGTILWNYSISGIGGGFPKLLQQNGRIFLINYRLSNSLGDLRIYEIEVETAVLTHLFTGGTRTAVYSQTWATTSTNGLLINIGGGHLFPFIPNP